MNGREMWMLATPEPELFWTPMSVASTPSNEPWPGSLTTVAVPFGLIVIRSSQPVSHPMGGHWENNGVGVTAEAARLLTSAPPTAVATTRSRLAIGPARLRAGFLRCISSLLFLLPTHTASSPCAPYLSDARTSLKTNRSLA